MRVVLFTGLFGAWTTPILRAFLKSKSVSVNHVFAQPFRQKSSAASFVDRATLVVSTKNECDLHNVPFSTIQSANTEEFIERARNLQCPLFISFGYGEIFKAPIINIPDLFLNIHPSMLPGHRGPDPFQSTLVNLEGAGFTAHVVSKKIDEGPIVFQKSFEAASFSSGAEMMHVLGAACAQSLEEILKNSKAVRIAQSAGSYFKKFNSSHFTLGETDSAEDIRRKSVAAKYNQWLHFFVNGTKIEIRDWDILKEHSGGSSYEIGMVIDYPSPSFSIQMNGYVLIVLDCSVPDFDSKTLEKMFLAETIRPFLRVVSR